jgi:hypothetical protein
MITKKAAKAISLRKWNGILNDPTNTDLISGECGLCKYAYQQAQFKGNKILGNNNCEQFCPLFGGICANTRDPNTLYWKIRIDFEERKSVQIPDIERMIKVIEDVWN